jgi:hypothetical protein
MQTVKMPNDTDPDDWAARINEFRRDHFPHLERPMTPKMLGTFILNYLPDALATDVRLLKNTLSDKDLEDTTAVVAKCMRLMRQLNPRTTPSTVPMQPISIMAATFYRPKAFKKESTGNGSSGNASKKADGSAIDFNQLYAKCFRKCCKVKHRDGDECYSWPHCETISETVAANDQYDKSLETRQEENAKRLNMTVKKFKLPTPTVPAASLTIGSLDVPSIAATGSLIPVAALTIEEMEQVVPDEADLARSELEQAILLRHKQAEIDELRLLMSKSVPPAPILVPTPAIVTSVPEHAAVRNTLPATTPVQSQVPSVPVPILPVPIVPVPSVDTEYDETNTDCPDRVPGCGCGRIAADDDVDSSQLSFVNPTPSPVLKVVLSLRFYLLTVAMLSGLLTSG